MRSTILRPSETMPSNESSCIIGLSFALFIVSRTIWCITRPDISERLFLCIASSHRLCLFRPRCCCLRPLKVSHVMFTVAVVEHAVHMDRQNRRHRLRASYIHL